MKGKAHGTQQPRHINLIGEGVNTAQRSNSLVQSINQRFPKEWIKWAVVMGMKVTTRPLQYNYNNN
jgi:hypothetical protein